MEAMLCDNPRCRAVLPLRARYCMRCGLVTGRGPTVSRPVRPVRRPGRFKRRWVILGALAVIGIGRLIFQPDADVSRQTFQPPRPLVISPTPDQHAEPAVPPSIAYDTPSESPGSGVPFTLALGPALQRFQIAASGWRGSRAPWGTPSVLWVDLRPVRALASDGMPRMLTASFVDAQGARRWRTVSSEWGSDAAGPLLHVWVDFNGLEASFRTLQLDSN